MRRRQEIHQEIHYTVAKAKRENVHYYGSAGPVDVPGRRVTCCCALCGTSRPD